MGGVKRGEKPKGQIISELIAEQPTLDTLGIVQELRKRGVEVSESYVKTVRTLVNRNGTWEPLGERGGADAPHRNLDMSEGSLNSKVADMVRDGCTIAEIIARLHTNRSHVLSVRKYLKEKGEDVPQGRAKAFRVKPQGKPSSGRGADMGEREKLLFDYDNESVVTWAGAFRKLANYCRTHGYADAYELAQAIAGIKEMRGL